jgi:hypothetical protein
MPKFKDRLLNLIVAMLPIIISGVFFSQIISTNIEMKNKFQVNDFVYLDYKEDTFAKSFNPKISIFIFYCVDSYLDSI